MPVVTAFIPGRPPALAHKRVVRIVTASDESPSGVEAVEWATDEVVVRHTSEGVQIVPSTLHGDASALGFRVLFFPWNEVRQIKEYDREG